MTSTNATPITILAAIDYSETSTLVVESALEAVRQKQADELHFLHVASAASNQNERIALRAQLGEWLDACLRRADGIPPGLKLVAHEAAGQPAHVIVEMSSDLLAALVVVGTHGRRGVQRALLGSVAEAVVRSAGCPVLVVRPQMHHHAAPSIEPPCPRCVQERIETHGQELWCEQHREKHGRRHTYYNTRLSTWVNQRITL